MKKKMGIVGILLVALCLAAIVFGRKGINNSDEEAQSASHITDASSNSADEKPEDSDAQKDSSSVEGAIEDSEKESADADTIGESLQGHNGLAGIAGNGHHGLIGTPEKDTNPNNIKLPDSETQTADPVVSFPAALSDTGVVVQNITSYSGIFLEDGSDADTGNVAIAAVANTSGSDVEAVAFSVQESGQTLTFEGSAIPAGATIIIQEKNGLPYGGGVCSELSGAASGATKFEMSDSTVSVDEQEDGSLRVQNLTGNDLPCLRVFYKFYLPEENAFVGGITYNSKITELKANDSVIITPSHYSKGNSKVVMVRTYNTAD